MILCPGRWSATCLRKIILKEILTGIYDGLFAKRRFNEIKPGLRALDDLILGLPVICFKIQNGWQFTVIVHGLYIINESGSLLFWVNITTKEMIRSPQKSSRFRAAPVIVEGRV